MGHSHKMFRQSPDGLKSSDMIIPSRISRYGVYQLNAYYLYPPKIKSSALSGTLLNGRTCGSQGLPIQALRYTFDEI